MNVQRVFLSVPGGAADTDLVELHLDPGEDITNVQRRVSKTATLDGGVAIYDSGYSAGDREFAWGVVTTPAIAATVLGWVKTRPLLHMICREGAFAVVPRSGRYTGSTLTLSLWVKSDLLTD